MSMFREYRRGGDIHPVIPSSLVTFRDQNHANECGDARELEFSRANNANVDCRAMRKREIKKEVRKRIFREAGRRTVIITPRPIISSELLMPWILPVAVARVYSGPL